MRKSLLVLVFGAALLALAVAPGVEVANAAAPAGFTTAEVSGGLDIVSLLPFVVFASLCALGAGALWRFNRT